MSLLNKYLDELLLPVHLLSPQAAFDILVCIQSCDTNDLIYVEQNLLSFPLVAKHLRNPSSPLCVLHYFFYAINLLPQQEDYVIREVLVEKQQQVMQCLSNIIRDAVEDSTLNLLPAFLGLKVESGQVYFSLPSPNKRPKQSIPSTPRSSCTTPHPVVAPLSARSSNTTHAHGRVIEREDEHVLPLDDTLINNTDPMASTVDLSIHGQTPATIQTLTVTEPDTPLSSSANNTLPRSAPVACGSPPMGNTRRTSRVFDEDAYSSSSFSSISSSDIEFTVQWATSSIVNNKDQSFDPSHVHPSSSAYM